MQLNLGSNNFTLIKELLLFFMMLTWKSTSKKWSLTLARLTHFKGFWHSCYRMLNRIGLTYILTYVFDNCKSVTVIAINWKWRNWGQIIICFLFLLTSLELTTLGSILYWKMRKDLRLRDLTGRRGKIYASLITYKLLKRLDTNIEIFSSSKPSISSNNKK